MVLIYSCPRPPSDVCHANQVMNTLLCSSLIGWKKMYSGRTDLWKKKTLRPGVRTSTGAFQKRLSFMKTWDKKLFFTNGVKVRVCKLFIHKSMTNLTEQKFVLGTVLSLLPFLEFDALHLAHREREKRNETFSWLFSLIFCLSLWIPR